MIRKIVVLFVFVILASAGVKVKAQQLIAPTQQFRMGERIIRIAEQGEIADSVNVWGDVGSSGRYLVPKGTNLVKLITYGLGPRTLNDGQTQLDWSKMRVEVNIQEYAMETGVQNIEKFSYRFEEPFPEGMSEFILKNNQTVTIRVKRKPSFRDYVGVIAPVISSIATSIIIIDRLGGN